MNYVKKMCILRQVKQGFSGDGKALSGLVKAEQYGKNLAVEVSVINFAPLVSGEYYCMLCDSQNRVETLPLRGKSLFNILTDMEIADGFCAVICFVKNEVVPIAYGVNGNGEYDWKRILSTTLSPLGLGRKGGREETAVSSPSVTKAEDKEQSNESEQSKNTPPTTVYDDENVATENYYREETHEQDVFDQTREDARTQSENQKQREKTGVDVSEDENVDGVLHPIKMQSDGYYRSVKEEIDDLMKKYPRDDTLKDAFACSEWVRVKGEQENPQYLVGVVYDNGVATYICYALVAENKDCPPEEIRDVCTFVPASPFSDDKGFFVIFQSASTGECIKPIRA